MLSAAQLSDGKVFLLKLWDADGVPSCWAETLTGEAAAYWYGLYRLSDWPALRARAAATFRTPVTDTEAARILKVGRCVYIHTRHVRSDDLAPAPDPT